MAVTPEERDAMARLLSVMEGKEPPPLANNRPAARSDMPIELPGAGQITSADISAMADVMSKLNALTDQVVGEMVTESQSNQEVRTAITTSRNDAGVKVGLYQIMIKEDEKRLAGKQYYSIYNTKTNDIIADDLSLYETALNVVKLLNSGKFANSSEVRKLFDYDDGYTSHKQDALRYKKAMMIAERKSDFGKRDIYESRCQASMDRAMACKKEIKRFKLGN